MSVFSNGGSGGTNCTGHQVRRDRKGTEEIPIFYVSELGEEGRTEDLSGTRSVTDRYEFSTETVTSK